MAKATYSLKDDLFNPETVNTLCTYIQPVYKDFDTSYFLSSCAKAFPSLELKERMTYMTQQLYKQLPKDYIEATTILTNSLDDCTNDSMFVLGSYNEYVSTYGCNDEHLEYSLNLLAHYTKWFSSEFAVRDFINHYPDETFAMMIKCSLSENLHQRRFASEGLRPKLPWAKAINFDYQKGASLLNNLYYDSERYVTRSVANHLNDLSKIDPEFVLSLLNQWLSKERQTPQELDYMINHSLRTLIKKGHRETLNFLGFHSQPAITISKLKIQERALMLGDSLAFSFDIDAQKDEKLIIDYQITYPMANDKQSTKVFKLKKALFKQGITSLSKKHPFRLMTTKKLYSGTYILQLQINGRLYLEEKFTLKV